MCWNVCLQSIRVLFSTGSRNGVRRFNNGRHDWNAIRCLSHRSVIVFDASPSSRIQFISPVISGEGPFSCPVIASSLKPPTLSNRKLYCFHGIHSLQLCSVLLICRGNKYCTYSVHYILVCGRVELVLLHSLGFYYRPCGLRVTVHLALPPSSRTLILYYGDCMISCNKQHFICSKNPQH